MDDVSQGAAKKEIGFRRTRKFIAGGIAGCIAKGVISPFDRIKILRQGEHSLYGKLSIYQSARTIVKTEGTLQLWRGFPALVIRIFPYAGVQFLCIDQYKNWWDKLRLEPSKEIGGLTVPTRNVLCGSLTGLTATVITYPLDTIRTRMLFTTKHDKRYDSWRNTVQSIKSSSGIKGFYNGVWPALFGMIFYGGISFGTYETLHDWALNSKSDWLDLGVAKIPIKKPNERGDVLTEWYVNSVFGMTAGLFSQFVCFPIDTAKRRMQNASLIETQRALSDRLSMIATWKDLWKRGGLRLIYRGFSLNVIRVLPATSISFMVNEELHNLFGVPRSKK